MSYKMYKNVVDVVAPEGRNIDSEAVGATKGGGSLSSSLIVRQKNNTEDSKIDSNEKSGTEDKFSNMKTYKFIGIGIAALALIGTIAYFATRKKK